MNPDLHISGPVATVRAILAKDVRNSLDLSQYDMVSKVLRRISHLSDASALTVLACQDPDSLFLLLSGFSDVTTCTAWSASLIAGQDHVRRALEDNASSLTPLPIRKIRGLHSTRVGLVEDFSHAVQQIPMLRVVVTAPGYEGSLPHVGICALITKAHSPNLSLTLANAKVAYLSAPDADGASRIRLANGIILLHPVDLDTVARFYSRVPLVVSGIARREHLQAPYRLDPASTIKAVQ